VLITVHIASTTSSSMLKEDKTLMATAEATLTRSLKQTHQAIFVKIAPNRLFYKTLSLLYDLIIPIK